MRRSINARPGVLILLSGLVLTGHLYADPPSSCPAKIMPRIQIPDDARFIDFQAGDDNNPGTLNRPWQHHPWDAAAAGIAASCRNARVYVFKGGVVYRGALFVRQSGTPGKPVVLTSDPSWGSGRARIYGSERVGGTWKQCTPQTEPRFPPDAAVKIWYLYLPLKAVPYALYEVLPGGAKAIPLARTPNWRVTDPDNPREHWWEFTGFRYTTRLKVDSTKEFAPGQRITGKGVQERDRIVVKEVLPGCLVLEITDWAKRRKNYMFTKPGAIISNGSAKTRVKKQDWLSNTTALFFDTKNLLQPSDDYYRGGVIWTEGDEMAKLRPATVLSYMPKQRAISVSDAASKMRTHGSFIRRHSRYFIEGLPQFLDAPGEWWYDVTKSRLYLRLAHDRDPNLASIEIGQRISAININDGKHIVIRGLEVAFLNAQKPNTQDWGYYYTQFCNAAIRVAGASSGVTIEYCGIHHVPNAISVFPSKARQVLQNIMIRRCDISDVEYEGVTVFANHVNRRRLCFAPGLEEVFAEAGGYRPAAERMQINFRGAPKMPGRPVAVQVRQCRARCVKLLGNHVMNVGYRGHSPCAGAGGCGIGVFGAELLEVAYNRVDRISGIGIEIFNGAAPRRTDLDMPLNRNLVHHNNLLNTMISVSDFGGLELWRSPMSYIYSNISGNAVGLEYPNYKDLGDAGRLKPASGSCLYLDMGMKCYVFNNILWGRNNNINDMIANPTGIHRAGGMLNTFFNNTIYNTAFGFHKGGRNNRTKYLNNLLLDQGSWFFGHYAYGGDKLFEKESLAYYGNVFYGSPRYFARFGPSRKSEEVLLRDIREFGDYLREKKYQVADPGVLCDKSPVVDMKAHDFRPRAGSPVIDRAAKVFVPWGLYCPVGEWNFIQSQPCAETGRSVVFGEHFDVSRDVTDYHKGEPRNDLVQHGIGTGNFMDGILETWAPGAVLLNGADEYFSLKNGYKLDMAANNFLLEAVVKFAPGSHGVIAGKRDGRGYELSVTVKGMVQLALHASGSSSRVSLKSIADNAWHHVIVEADRSRPQGINIYIDGKLSNGAWSGKPDISSDISSNAAFLIGRSANGACTPMAIDFLRVCRGTLEDARTTIDETYDWEFNGPFLRDFFGRSPTGARRDSGAIEKE